IQRSEQAQVVEAALPIGEPRAAPHRAPAVLGHQLLELDVEAVGRRERARDVLLAEHPGACFEADVEELLVHGDLQYGAVPRVYAVKYAERDARRAEHFLGGDPHDAPMPMDYFVWAVVGDDETWVVDTGFGTLDAARRNRRLLRTAADALATISVD